MFTPNVTKRHSPRSMRAMRSHVTLNRTLNFIFCSLLVGFASSADEDTGIVSTGRIFEDNVEDSQLTLPKITAIKPIAAVPPTQKALKEIPGPFFEPGFPCFQTKLDLTEKEGPFRDNFAVRGLILPLADNLTLGFDQDLLRVTGFWIVPEGTPPVTLRTMAQASYEKWSRKADHQHPTPTGSVLFPTALKPGAAIDLTALQKDPREKNSVRDYGRGPLPLSHGRFDGVQICGQTAVLHYRLADTAIREWHEAKKIAGQQIVFRHFSVAPGQQPVHFSINTGTWTVVHARLATGKAMKDGEQLAVLSNSDTLVLSLRDGDLIATLAPSQRERQASIAMVSSAIHAPALATKLDNTPPVPMSEKKRHWPESVTTDIELNQVKANGLTLDMVGLPENTPWKRRVRPADIGFISPDHAAVVTYDGDVWLISGPLKDAGAGKVTWQRFATGLHESLALCIVDGVIQVLTKNGIVRLHDKDGNGEADWYENFCDLMRQSQSTRAFPLDMDVGPDGSFYISQGGIGFGVRGSLEIGMGDTGQGSIARIAPDGRSLEIISRGAREPFVAVHPRTGLLTGTDQQGHFVPTSVAYLIRPGDHFGFDKEKPPNLTPPLTWIPHSEDNSSASQLWISGKTFGVLDDKLLHLSYGNGSLHLISPDLDAPIPQGAVIPLSFETGLPLLQGHTHPDGNAIWLAGFQVYDSRSPTLQGLGRLRMSGETITKPVSAQSCIGGVIINFAAPLKSESVRAEQVAAQSWNYVRSKNYGSGHFRNDGTPGMDILGVSQAVLSQNKQSVFVHVPDLTKPVMQLEVRYSFQFENGTPAEGVTYYTIHQPHKINLDKAGFTGLDLTKTATVLRTKDEGAATVEMGKSLSLTMSCVACHSIDGAKDGRTGPTWKGLFASKREFVDGTSASANEDYLRESIIDPQCKIVKGFAPGMASYSGVLSDKQIEALIMYIRSLE